MLNDYDTFLEEIGLTQEDVANALQDLDEPISKKDWEPYTTGPSKIHGTGVFTTVSAPVGCPLAIMKVGEEWTVAGRYVNHSSEPNCYVYKVGDTIMLEAYTPVTVGDELTIDYRDMKDALEDDGQRCQIIDDFCDDPETVVASVKAAGFDTWLPSKGQVGSSIYEGMGFWGNHASMVKAIIKHTEKVVVPNTMFFRVTNQDTENAYIHSDRTTGAHTCVCYLSEHGDSYGTAFYRHKPTGLIMMPSFEEMEILGLSEQFKEDMVSRSVSKWEMLDFVQGKFNRAVIFDAPLFHSRIPITGFGDNDEEGRLIWGSHFYKLRGSGELY